MGSAPIPVVFEPEFQPRPWGGRRLAELLNKALPPDEPIGESWELLDTPAFQSRVRDGPMRGRTIQDLIREWGTGLLGGLSVGEGRFPLNIRLLNAEALSDVTVSRPAPIGAPAFGMGGTPVFRMGGTAVSAVSPTDEPPVETSRAILYILHAQPASEIRLGLKAGLATDALRSAIGTGAVASLLRRGAARRGQCYQIPAGVPWALGGGIVAIQIEAGAPTVRLRLDGPPRDSIEGPALDDVAALIRPDLPLHEIMQQRRHVGSVFSTSTRLVSRDQVLMERIRLVQGLREEIDYGELTLCIVLSGRGAIETRGGECPYGAGDVLLIPAACVEPHVRTESDSEWLELKLPIPSSLEGIERPPREPPPARGEHVPLTRGGRPLGESEPRP
jgi:mannose-6-phosphate isomerase